MKRYRFNTVISLFALFAAFLSGTGCVSQEVEPEHKPKLSVVQNADGSIAMHLDTKEDHLYTILYLSPTEKTWQVVKGCESITGTGETVIIHKQFRKGQQIPPFTVDFVKKK